MKRSGFKRAEYTKPPRPPLTLGNKVSAAMVKSGEGVSVPKFDYVRSKPLMEAYRRLACQNCEVADGTVCGAHSNWAEHGKGRSIKASDVFCASLCYSCHTWLDTSGENPNEQRLMWNRAHLKTIGSLIELSWEPGEHKLRALLQKVGIVKA